MMSSRAKTIRIFRNCGAKYPSFLSLTAEHTIPSIPTLLFVHKIESERQSRAPHSPVFF